ncbi:Dirigent protein 2 [Camellia lanceoleosa]|uniref:Dirigent protein 2 n=1 Tax=Camellia lanceoleosa TaxID=1840588 RepID=A0ACC0IN91_9ERIC|nr:Dirigent protein 2 [Camellia lanceoleosa]
MPSRENALKKTTLFNKYALARESKKKKIHEHSNHNLGFCVTKLRPIEPSSTEMEVKEEKGGGLLSREVELVHPWPEWIELVERVAQAVTTNNSLTLFDLVAMADDPLTEGPDPSSKLVGRA